MSIGNIAKQMTDHLKHKSCDWFCIVAMMDALIDIRVTYELEGGEEASVVGDGKKDMCVEVIASTLLKHTDMDVVEQRRVVLELSV